jgi:hypothetical protein
MNAHVCWLRVMLKLKIGSCLDKTDPIWRIWEGVGDLDLRFRFLRIKKNCASKYKPQFGLPNAWNSLEFGCCRNNLTD